MFCPVCESEYRIGFAKCEGCGVDLVPRLPARDMRTAYENYKEPAMVFVTGDSNEAALVKSLLEGSGVKVSLRDEHMMALDSPLSIVVGGVKVLVPAEQEEVAREVLTEYRGSAGQDPGIGRIGAFTMMDRNEAPEIAGANDNDPFLCAHCRTLLEVETTLCPHCGREPW